MSISIKPAISSPPGRRRLFLLRPRVWMVFILLASLGYGANYIWQRTAPSIANHPQYRLTSERIQITPAPPWIRSDVKADVLRDAGLERSLSVLDDWDVLSRRVKEAFEFHPWVESVQRITKRPPGSLEIELKYRRPIAAVESSDASGVTFLPIDAQAIRLPETDLTDAERSYLPRICGVSGRPLIGDFWDDPRVVGGAKLAAALADIWERLRLVEILCAKQNLSDEKDRVYTYELVTSGGTRIVWGAAPGHETSAGESPLEQKRKRLLEYATQHGRLESIEGPAKLDVRSELVVTPRTARTKPAANSATTK